jgi:hypothetical protein
MSDHYSNIPSYKAPRNFDNLDSYEAYFEELQAKSHNLACCFGRMTFKHPNHPEIVLWKEKSIFWHEYHSNLKYMETPIENAFKVFEAIGSFAAEYDLYTEFELELRNKLEKNRKITTFL